MGLGSGLQPQEQHPGLPQEQSWSLTVSFNAPLSSRVLGNRAWRARKREPFFYSQVEQDRENNKAAHGDSGPASYRKVTGPACRALVSQRPCSCACALGAAG